MLFFNLIFVYMHIFHVFYGGPHGRIADRLNVFTLIIIALTLLHSDTLTSDKSHVYLITDVYPLYIQTGLTCTRDILTHL